MSQLVLTTEGDRVIVVSRFFAASPAAVYRAHTDPVLVRQWMLGPDGWDMPVCESEVRPGGKIHYQWRNQEGHSFSLTGEFVELDPPHRIVHIERMHLPDPTPDNRVETTFSPENGGTRMIMRMNLPSAEVRAAMLATGMADGMERSYQRYEQCAAELPAFQ
jgi:uncharacterized protein YndB with AHSA1/START domain